MATIYDLSTGRIISENTGVTTIENHAELPGYDVALQPVRQGPEPTNRTPVDEYMCLIRELLKNL